MLGAIAPFGISGYWLRFITFIFMWIGLAGSLNLLTGYTGYLDFGHVAFFGIGAYTTGVLMVKLGMPFFPAMFMGAILAGILALLVGIPTMRLRGAYFAIAMLAFAEAMKQVALEFDGITGGGNGLSLPIYTNYRFFYYMMFSVVLLIIGATFWFEKSKFGKALMAIREAELAAEVSGVNTFYCKLIAFGISAFTAGIIGGIYAYWMTFLYPGDAFNVLLTMRMIIMAFLGGAGTLLGPIIGAAFLAAIEEVLWAEFKYTYLIIVGFIVVFVVLVLPRGLVGLFRQRGLAE
jgi:branched-chain amino acid transport system permease protein